MTILQQAVLTRGGQKYNEALSNVIITVSCVLCQWHNNNCHELQKSLATVHCYRNCALAEQYVIDARLELDGWRVRNPDWSTGEFHHFSFTVANIKHQ